MPKSKLILTFFLIIAAVSVYVGVSIIAAQTWEEPTCSDPTTCNAPEPINTGDTLQAKTGSLKIGGGTSGTELTKYLYVKGDITGANGTFVGDITADGGNILATSYSASVAKYVYIATGSGESENPTDQTSKTPRCQSTSFTNYTINCDINNNSSEECNKTTGVDAIGDQVVPFCYDWSSYIGTSAPVYVWSKFESQDANTIGGWITGTNGYNNTISIGGDATGNDLEIAISAPENKNLISFKNTTLGTRAQIDATFIGELSTSSLINAINTSSGDTSFINSLTQTINSGSNGLLGTWLQNGSYLYASSTDWNVGIGTSAPSSKLTIQDGNISLTNKAIDPPTVSGNYFVKVATYQPKNSGDKQCTCDITTTNIDCINPFLAERNDDVGDTCYDNWEDNSSTPSYPRADKYEVKEISSVSTDPTYTAQPEIILNDAQYADFWYSLKNSKGNLELNSGSGHKTYLGQDGYFNVNNGKFIVDANGSSTISGNAIINGNVGIGVSSFDSNYKITANGGGIKAENSSAQPAGYFSSTGGGPAIQTGTGNVLVSDNIGINVSSPEAKLHGKNNIYTSLTGISATANSAEITISTGIENFDVDDYINLDGVLKRVTAVDTTTKKITLDSNFDSAISGKTLYLYKPLIRLDNTDDVPKFVVTANGDINFTGELLQNGTPFKVSQWSDVTGGIYYNDGNVGIGTNAPNSKLSILGNLTLLRESGSNIQPGPGSSLVLQSPSSDISAVPVDEDGNGLLWEYCGSSSSNCVKQETVPTKNIEDPYECVSSDAGISYYDIDQLGTGATKSYYYTKISCESGTASYSLRTDNGVLKFLNNDNQEKISVDQSGNVGIGMTPTSAVKLGVNGGISISGGVETSGNYILGGTDVTTGPFLQLFGNSYSADTSRKGEFTAVSYGSGDIRFYNQPTANSWKELMRIDKNGTSTFSGNISVGNTGTSVGGWYVSSDSRLKTNITPLTNILPKLDNINAVGFNWKTGGARQIGFIAQEVEKEFPELVNTDDKGYKSLDYSKMSAVLLGAVKELKAENDNLKSRIEKLETSR